ncbi:hypothetical protein Rruber_01401 [Rhodococcus ruber]
MSVAGRGCTPQSSRRWRPWRGSGARTYGRVTVRRAGWKSRWCGRSPNQRTVAAIIIGSLLNLSTDDAAPVPRAMRSSSSAGASAVIDCSTNPLRHSRAYSSTTERVLICWPSAVESNWISIAYISLAPHAVGTVGGGVRDQIRFRRCFTDPCRLPRVPAVGPSCDSRAPRQGLSRGDDPTADASRHGPAATPAIPRPILPASGGRAAGSLGALGLPDHPTPKPFTHPSLR